LGKKQVRGTETTSGVATVGLEALLTSGDI